VAELAGPTVWTVIGLVAVGTYLLRVSFVEALADRDIPPRVEAALRFVPAAVLAGLVLPKLLLVDGGLVVSPDNHRLLAGIAAAVAAFYTEDMFATVAVGMGALWSLIWFAGL
jgi:branched-subunit amino acid transport protein